MNILKKSLAAVAAAVCGSAAMLPQVSTLAAPAAGTALAALALTAATPSVAHAQTNKRMCGRIWWLTGGSFARHASISVVMEVNKWDVVTCTSLQALYTALTALPSGVRGWAQVMFGNQGNPITGTQGSFVYMQTCESYSSRVNLSVRDVCLQMQDYKFYSIINVGGQNWALKKF